MFGMYIVISQNGACSAQCDMISSIKELKGKR